MNWGAIGAIGEVIGAAGVILTLVYLAYQIKQNTIQLKQPATSVSAKIVSRFLKHRKWRIFSSEVTQIQHN